MRGLWRHAASALAAAVLATTVVLLDPTPAAAAFAPAFVRSWGVLPTQPTDLSVVKEVAVDPSSGTVFVYDYDTIRVYGSDGGHLRSWTPPGTNPLAVRAIAVSPSSGNLVLATACDLYEVDPLGATVWSASKCGSPGQLQSASALAIGSNGRLYVLDTATHQVVVFDSTGAFVTAWGSHGTASGQFSAPVAVAVSPSGDLVVGDNGPNKVQVFTVGGTYLRGWGATGTGAGQFSEISGVTAGADGSVYVADVEADRVQRFAGDGTFVTAWGARGTRQGQFDEPTAIAAGPSGRVYVGDDENERVQRFSADGTWQLAWGDALVDGRMNHPHGVATAGDGTVYVADTHNNRVQVFTATGAFLRKWTIADGPGGVLADPYGIAVDDATGDVFVADSGHHRIQRYTATGAPLDSWGGAGTGDGQFQSPTWLALDGEGHLYVTDEGNDRIQQFTLDGEFVRSWGSSGTGNGQFSVPRGLAVGADGKVYVADDVPSNLSTDRIQVFTAEGAFVAAWGSSGTSTGRFIAPSGIAVDGSGEVYVSDCATRRVQRFSASGAYLAQWGSLGTSNGEFQCPAGLSIRGGTTSVADSHDGGRARVQQFAYPVGPQASVTLQGPAGEFVAGQTLTYQVTIDNPGSVPLTGVTTALDPASPDCARSLPDIPADDGVTFSCAYVATVGDAGALEARATVHTNELAPIVSAPVVNNVRAMGDPALVRTWTASSTTLEDGDPLSGWVSSSDQQGIATDAAGQVFYAGARLYPPEVPRVQRFVDGVAVGGFGPGGSGNGQLTRPQTVAVAPDGDVFTTECTLGRVQRFSSAGVFEQSWTLPVDGQGCSPTDLDVAPDGTAYVVDRAALRVATISPAGTLSQHPNWFADSSIAVGPDGSVYVPEPTSYRVRRYTADGTFLGQWGAHGAGNGQFGGITEITTDASGRVYVVDVDNGPQFPRIQVFTAEGTFLTKFQATSRGFYDIAAHVDDDGTTHVYAAVGRGTLREYVFPAAALLSATLTPEDDQVSAGTSIDYELEIENLGTQALTGVTVDPDGLAGCGGPTADLAIGASATLSCTLLATHDDTHRIHRRVVVDTDQTAPVASNNTAVEVQLDELARWGGTGAGPGQLRSPRGVAVTWSGHLYVADCGNDRVQHFDTDGNVLGEWGTTGTGPGQFRCPRDLTITSTGDVVVLDRDNRRVQQFTSTGTYVRSFGTGTTGPGVPVGIDVDDDDNVYVTDGEPSTTTNCREDIWGNIVCDTVPPSGNNRIRRFSPTGVPHSSWGGYSSHYLLKGLWITSSGRVFTAGDSRVEVDTLTGTSIGEIDGWARDDIAVDRFGYLWTTGWFGVQRLSPGGSPLGLYPIAGASGITVDRDHVYVTSTSSNEVIKLGVAPRPGTIEGTVVADGSGDAVAGAYVVALRAGTMAFAAGAVTDATGSYELAVPAGEYLVEFADPSGRHRFEWFDDEPNPASFDEVARVAVAGGAVEADASLAPLLGSLSGTVTADGGGPLAGVHAVALRGGATSGSAVTDGDGRYSIPDLVPGSYTVVFVDPSASHRPEFHEDSVGPQGAATLAVAAGEDVTVDAALAPVAPPVVAGHVRGTVTDDAGGDPVVGALVVALRPSDLGFVGAALTGADGRYALPVPAGEHHLEIADPSGRHQFEWFDDEPLPASFAALTPVSAGATASAEVHALRGSIAGTVTATGGGPLAGVWVVASGAGGIRGATTGPDGTYRIDGLAPGSYLLITVDPTGAHPVEFHLNRPSPAGSSAVTVTAAGTTEIDTDLG